MQAITRRLKGAVAAALTAASLTVAAPAAAQDVDFAGQTIEWWIPFSEGGGSDVWARFFAPYLSRHLPGNPNVDHPQRPRRRLDHRHQRICRPRATERACSFWAPRVRPSSPSCSATRASATIMPISSRSSSRPRAASSISRPRWASRTPRELGQVADQELVYASQGATSLDLVPMLAFEVLGLNVRHVFGMTGRGDGRLAFERGEATIDYQTSSAYLTNVVPLVEAGTAVPLFSYGVLDAEGNVQRDPSFPEIPHFVEAYEMMHGEAPSGVAFDAYMAFFSSGFAAQKPAMLPGGTPENIVQAYRDAFSAAVEDPDLIASAGEVLGDYNQATGDEVVGLYEVATTINPEAREWVRTYLTENHSVMLD